MRRLVYLLVFVAASMLLYACLSTSTGHIEWDIFNKTEKEQKEDTEDSLSLLEGFEVKSVECFWTGLAAGLLTGGLSLGTSIGNYFAQKNTQEETWRREDTAVQRRVADLKAAGLSPTLAAGSAASSGVTSAPQFNGGAVTDALNSAAQVAAIKNARQENANMKASEQNIKADTLDKYAHLAMTDAQRAYYVASANNLEVDNQLKSYSMLEIMESINELKARAKGHNAAAMRDTANALLTDLQYQVFANTGVSPSMNGTIGDFLRRFQANAKNKSGPVFSYKPKFGEYMR